MRRKRVTKDVGAQRPLEMRMPAVPFQNLPETNARQRAAAHEHVEVAVRLPHDVAHEVEGQGRGDHPVLRERVRGGI